MYKKYSNKGYRGQKSESFSNFNSTSGKISIQDLNGWRRDFKLTKFVSKEELMTLIRLINQKRGGKKVDVSHMDLKGFQELFVQLAIFGFSKGDNNLMHMPPVHSV